VSVTWIEASAGTGKTYTLVRRVLDLIGGGLHVDKILLVTFTEKATAELKTRIRQGLRAEFKASGSALLAQALEDLPSLSITTIHGFCRTLLSQFPLESGVSFEPELVDQGRQWRRLLRDEVRPRLGSLDPGLLAWAGLEDEEDLLALAQAALGRDVFSLPLLHPDAPERVRFQALRVEIEGLTGPFWAAADLLKGVRLPADSKAAFGEETVSRLLHARNHLGPYRLAADLGAARSWRDLRGLMAKDSLAALERWDEGGSVWKKAAVPPFDGALEVVRTACTAFSAAARAVESALAPGTELLAFLAGSARQQLLDDLCRPVLDRRSPRELTFHDLIDRVHRLVTTPAGASLTAGARDRWKAVLIDEFQDTDPGQWEIFSSLFLDPDHELVLVGDPKQSIYRFRGADLDLYRAVRDQVKPQAETRVLGQNFRSTAPMIDAVNRLFDPARAPWDHPEDFTPSTKGDKPVGQLVRLQNGVLVPLPPVAAFQAGTERSWHLHLVDTVLDLLDGTHFLDDGSQAAPLTPGDLMLLVRKKREAWTLQRLLTARGLPAVVGGSGGLLKTREAREVLLFLKALESPRSLAAARALGWTRLFAGATVDQLAPALDEARDDRDAGAYLRAFRRVAAALEPGVVDGGGLERLLTRPGGARLVTNAEHVLELVQERHHRGDVAGGRAALTLETWMESGLQEDEVDLRRDTESRTIRLMTVHAAKGLEAPVVLHGFPSAPGKNRDAWIIARGVDYLFTEASRLADQKNQAAEDLRLRYVAWTRAQTHQVFVDQDSPVSVPERSEEPGRTWVRPVEDLPALPPLGDRIPDLDRRHPWVESHSGLWRRATRAEADAPTVWDRPRVRRDEEGDTAEPTYFGDELPAGPAFGDLVHDILEAADFRAWAPGAGREPKETVSALVEEHCQRHRADFQGRDLTKPLGAWLGRILNQPLDLGAGQNPVTFTDLAPNDTRRELEFHLPLALGTTGEFSWGGRGFTVHPGYLTGRIDLLFRWEGRLYLADWKTNRLGPDQDPAELMAEAGYDLQAQWYWEALNRLCRLQGEALEPGGVLYVFLRGAQDRPRGVFLSPARLRAVSTLSPFLQEVDRG